MMRGRTAWIGLVVAATGCVDRGGIGLDDETSTDPTGADDPTAEDDPGEEGPNDVPLELVLVNLNKTGQFLLLRFSEPMAPVDAVDPADFRLSLARSVYYTGYYGQYSWSIYVDPGVYYNYNYYDPSPMVVTKVAAGKKETDILLRFETALDPQVCDWLAQLEEILENDPSQQGKVGLFIHYSPGAVPVESLDGEVLSPIGPDWVEYDASFMSVEAPGWPNLDPQLPIPCNL